jgi:hypothetical protein
LDVLVTFSPELNPDELFNHDVRANAVGRKQAKRKSEMMERMCAVICASSASSTSTHVVKRFFREERVMLPSKVFTICHSG